MGIKPALPLIWPLCLTQPRPVPDRDDAAVQQVGGRRPLERNVGQPFHIAPVCDPALRCA